MRRLQQKQHRQNKPGFTIIEVTLVTAFIAMLLIAIATIFASMISVYQKGMTLKTINSAGRNLIAELTSSINAAPSLDSTSLCNSLLDGEANVKACIEDDAFNFVYQSLENTSYFDNIIDFTNTVESGPIQYSGVFCTGDYSYIWNTKYGRESDRMITLHYTDVSGTHDVRDFKIARFKDKTYRACTNNVAKSDYNRITLADNRVVDVTHYANGGELLITDLDTDFLEVSVNAENGNENDAEINLDLYELTIFPVSQDSVTLRAFFSGTFILGTERGNASIVRTGDYCDVTNVNGTGESASNLQDLGSEFNYCGINKFNFAARTAGSGI